MNEKKDQPHRRHRPYQRSKVKALALATIARADDAEEESSPFDPFIPGEDVGGGDPGVAFLLATEPYPDDSRRA